jgi:hypothetical protein
MLYRELRYPVFTFSCFEASFTIAKPLTFSNATLQRLSNAFPTSLVTMHPDLAQTPFVVCDEDVALFKLSSPYPPPALS